ncbi:MAG: hypothetical protein IV100_28095, partial [Myxococcales bacterium]|nr:hypothetical protein [Myxococcales bacterium]
MNNEIFRRKRFCRALNFENFFCHGDVATADLMDECEHNVLQRVGERLKERRFFHAACSQARSSAVRGVGKCVELAHDEWGLIIDATLQHCLLRTGIAEADLVFGVLAFVLNLGN